MKTYTVRRTIANLGWGVYEEGSNQSHDKLIALCSDRNNAEMIADSLTQACIE